MLIEQLQMDLSHERAVNLALLEKIGLNPGTIAPKELYPTIDELEPVTKGSRTIGAMKRRANEILAERIENEKRNSA